MFRIGDVDLKALRRFDNMLAGVGADGPKVANRAINRTGDMARTQVVKALAKQTGLPQKLIRRSVKVKRSSWSDLSYQLKSAGGDVSLKYFAKRETRDGVVANLGEGRGREVFAESFFRGGVFPQSRVDIRGMGGHVFVRSGGRTELEKLRSGVFIRRRWSRAPAPAPSPTPWRGSCRSGSIMNSAACSASDARRHFQPDGSNPGAEPAHQE